MKFQIIPFGKGKNRILFIHLKRPMKNGFAGMVTSNIFKDERIAIMVDNENTVTDYDFAGLTLTKTGFSSINMDKEVFYGIKQGNPMARMILFHELGHYYYGDLQNKDFKQEEYQKRRENAIKNGGVVDEEVRADAFALNYLDLEYVTKALEILKEKIQEKYGPDKDAELIIEEINIRMQKIS